MRIISGTLKGKILKSPENGDTRPTSDKARQAIFNIIEHSPFANGIYEKNILDVFAGTGAFGLEALSRGALLARFIENSKAAQRVLQENINACKMNEKAYIIKEDAQKLSFSKIKFDVIFLDPPYGKNLLLPALNALKNSGFLADDAFIIAEHHRDETFEFPQDFEILKSTNYGLNGVTFGHYIK